MIVHDTWDLPHHLLMTLPDHLLITLPDHLVIALNLLLTHRGLQVPAGADAAEALPETLPTSRCLVIERISRQRLSLRMHRLLVTMLKVREPTNASEGLEGAEDEGAVAGAQSGASDATRPTAPLEDGGSHPDKPWLEWWKTVDQIEEANAGEARRVW